MFLYEFADNRPDIVRKQIADQFNLTGMIEVSLVSETSLGYIRINSINIRDDEVGINNSGNWTGIYYQGVPIQINAIPLDGFTFSHWEVTGTDLEDFQNPEQMLS